MKCIFSLLCAILYLGCDGPTAEKESVSRAETANNTREKAKILTLDSPQAFRFSSPEDVEYFRINLAKSGLLKFIFGGVPQDVTIHYSLQDEEGHALISHYIQGGTDTSFHYAAKDADYFLALRLQFTSIVPSVTMNVAVERDAFDTLEYNNDTTHANFIALEQWHKSKILPREDIDFFRFTLASPSILVFKFDSISNKLDLHGSLLDREGVPIQIMYGEQGKPLERAYILGAGDYFLKIQDRTNYGSSEHYFLFGAFTYKEDTCEWNNDTAHAFALQLNQEVRGSLYPAEDRDFFRMAFADSTNLQLKIDSVSRRISMRAEVYDSELQLIARMVGLPGESVDLRSKVPAGNYFIVLSNHITSNYSKLLYRLRVNEMGIN